MVGGGGPEWMLVPASCLKLSFSLGLCPPLAPGPVPPWMTGVGNLEQLSLHQGPPPAQVPHRLHLPGASDSRVGFTPSCCLCRHLIPILPGYIPQTHWGLLLPEGLFIRQRRKE